jgi:PAS domain S-box-containing protein
MPPADHALAVLAEVAALADLAWFQVDAERRVVHWSAAAERLTGFTAAETLGGPCIGSVRCTRCLAGCGLYEHGAVDTPITLFTKGGDELVVRKHGHVLRDEDGEVTGGVEILEPVDADASPMAREMVDTIADALHRIWLAADDGLRVVDFSSGLLAVTGWTADQVRGRSLAELLGGEAWAENSPFRKAVARGERREGRSASLVTASGAQVPMSLSAGRGADGRVHVMMRLHSPASDEDRGYTEFEGMVARSPSMLRIFRLIDILHDNESTALICGESGTGKELVARAIHNRSSRASGPFVAVNCGALPAELLESELFGHVRGAFTGAFRDRPGRFELAEGGSLFLDEVGDLPLALQVKLLRVLEDRTYQRVGESRTRSADVRVIAATNVNLKAAVAEKRFREDLYYRLRVLPVDIPPMRERPEDLGPLIRHLLDRIGRHRGRAVQLSPTAMRCLLAHDWPGNVRELENTLEFATAVCEGQTVHVRDLPAEVRRVADADDVFTPAPVRAADSPTDADPEARRIRDALERAHYRRDEAAKLLGISRTTLWRKLKQHGIT